jgi:hypothetical protein
MIPTRSARRPSRRRTWEAWIAFDAQSELWIDDVPVRPDRDDALAPSRQGRDHGLPRVERRDPAAAEDQVGMAHREHVCRSHPHGANAAASGRFVPAAPATSS